MNIREIEEVLRLMRENDLAEFEVEQDGFRLSLKRPSAVAPLAAQPAAPAAAAAGGSDAPSEAEAGLVEIKAPIVGTFYRASAPDADPFVTVGQEVDEDTVVCLVEAMKVMNEIKAEVRGIVRNILVDNATAVQFGQPLFKVEPL